MSWELTINGTGDEAQAKDVIEEAVKKLQKEGSFGVTARMTYGSEMNRQVMDISVPAADEPESIPGQIPNSPYEGPGPVSRESFAARPITVQPELSGEQKKIQSENEKEHKKMEAGGGPNADAKKQGELAKQQREQADEDAKAATQDAVDRGAVIPMSPDESEKAEPPKSKLAKK